LVNPRTASADSCDVIVWRSRISLVGCATWTKTVSVQ
jgi:hypothetical protein